MGYERRFRFAADQLGRERGDVHGGQLDRELDEIAMALDGVDGAVSSVVGPSGFLPGVVGIEQLKADVLALLASSAWEVRGAWNSGTAYSRGDVVGVSGVGWFCVVAHVAGASFATDAAAGRWVSLSGDVLAASVAVAPIQGMVAADVQSALAELKSGLAAPRDQLRNGTFRVVWPEVPQPSPAASTGYWYVAERWLETASGGTTMAASVVRHAAGALVGGDQPLWHHAAEVVSGGGPGSFAMSTALVHGVEASANRRMCVAFSAAAPTPKLMAVEVSQVFGAGGSQSVHLPPQKVVVDGTWQRRRLYFDMPSIAGKVVGAADASVRVTFWYDAGSEYSAQTVGLGNQSGPFWLSNAKFFPAASDLTPEPEAVDFATDEDHCLMFREAGVAVDAEECTTVGQMVVRNVQFARRKLVAPYVSITAVAYGSPALGRLAAISSSRHMGFDWTYAAVPGQSYRTAYVSWLADVGF